MEKIYAKYFNYFEVGDDFPIIIMGVLNLSPESFYRESVYEESNALENAAIDMVDNGARMLDLGARSTAPWSKKISINEEIERIVPAVEKVCKVIPKKIILSIDTQYTEVARKACEITKKYQTNVIINDVSCFKTDPDLIDFIIENKLPIILMASRNRPGDLLTIEEIVKEFEITLEILEERDYNIDQVILDPGIGHWVEEKTYKYDLQIIKSLDKLRILKKPILIALSRKSFIGTALNKPDPKDRLNGTLSATAIAIYNGAHIVRTHDVNPQLKEIISMAKQIRHI